MSQTQGQNCWTWWQPLEADSVFVEYSRTHNLSLPPTDELEVSKPTRHHEFVDADDAAVEDDAELVPDLVSSRSMQNIKF